MKQLYFYYILFVLLFVPLLFVTNTGELFEFPKTFFIYFSALVLLSLYGIDLIIKFKKPTQPSLTVLLYLVILVLTTITSMHLYTSVWGYYTRFNEGLLSVLAFFSIYFVAKNKLDAEDISRLSNALLLPIIPISIYGIFQYFGVLAGKVVFGEAVERVYSTFGQPNWLAQYLVMLLPLVLFKIFEGVRSWFWYGLFFLGYTCLWFTFSLSGFAGFGATFVLSLFFLYKKIGLSEMKIKIGLLLIYMFCLLILFPGILQSRLHDLKQDIFGFSVHSVYAQSNTTPQDPSKYQISDAGYIRKSAWAGTVHLIKSSPKVFWVGTGPETYPYSFQPFRPRELNYSSEWAFLFNKPHNYYLELWAETGLLGVISYLILFAHIFKRQSLPTRIALLGYAVTNIFGWPVVATTLVFWFWLIESEISVKEPAL